MFLLIETISSKIFSQYMKQNRIYVTKYTYNSKLKFCFSMAPINTFNLSIMHDLNRENMYFTTMMKLLDTTSN